MPEQLRIPAIVITSVLFVLVTTVRLKWHPFISLLAAAMLAGLLQGKPAPEIVAQMASGFGSMAEGIGIIVAFGAMIGVSLEESGAAGALARKILQVAGLRNSGLVMALIAALVGIPVFADSGFIMLSAPARHMALLQSPSHAVMPLATAAGLYSTHVLVPPTPGPLAAAANLGLADELGTVMLVGLVTALPALAAGYWWVHRTGRRIPLTVAASDEADTAGDTAQPGTWVSLTPILLPVLLIMGGNLARTVIPPGQVQSMLQTVGQPVVALAIGMAACLLLPGARPSGLMAWIGKGISQAGPIVLITAAGGSFGAILKTLPVEQLLGKPTLEAGSGWVLLPIGFSLAAILKTAQGSSTAAMIIASSLVAPLMIPYGIGEGLAPAFLVTAIGGGAMMVSHGNDSYFWVVSRFGGLSMKDTLYGFSLATVWMGLVTLVASCIGWWWFV
jgi:gluconate:H+ symporter, GntP family